LVARPQEGVVGVIAKVSSTSAMSYLPETAPVGGDAFTPGRRDSKNVTRL
jgi:hypothetical protein